MDHDPRVDRVEASLTDFYRVVATAPGITATDHAGITTFASGLPHPLLNGVLADAGPEPGTERQRVEEVVGPLQRSGTPFLWWCGPSVWSAELEQALSERGVATDVLPGMHHRLDEVPTASAPSGATIRLGDDVGLDEFTGTLAEGFDLPADLVGPFTDVLAHFDPGRLVNALALLDGAAVGCGSLLLSGRTGGIYNVATLDRARRRGIGLALTAALLAAARDLRCTESVLVATEVGEPVYRRAGFEPVCAIREFLWAPG